MKKIIASDYDGTLNQHSIVAPRDIDAIKRWRDEGNLFGIVTGRGIIGILKECDYYSIPYDFLICNNGSEIYNNKKELLFRADSDPKVLPDLCGHIIKGKGLHATVSSSEQQFSLIYEGQTPSESPYVTWITPDKLSEIEFFTQVDTHFSSDSQAESFAESINSLFSDYICAFPNGVNIDIVPKGASKPAGVAKYLEIMGLSQENLYVVGDNLNDLPMLTAFDGYVIESGNPKVVSQIKNKCKNIADLIEKQAAAHK